MLLKIKKKIVVAEKSRLVTVVPSLMKNVGRRFKKAISVKNKTNAMVTVYAAAIANFRWTVSLELVEVKVTIALITCNPAEVNKPISWIVTPKFIVTGSVKLPMKETRPLIIRAQLSKRTLSDPYLRKLFPEIAATNRLEKVKNKKFRAMIRSGEARTGSGAPTASIRMTKANKTKIGIKPSFM